MISGDDFRLVAHVWYPYPSAVSHNSSISPEVQKVEVTICHYQQTWTRVLSTSAPIAAAFTNDGKGNAYCSRTEK